MTRTRSYDRKRTTAAALLASASAIALLAGPSGAAAQDCAVHAAPPADLATPSMLYEALSARTTAQLLAIGFMRKPVAQDCAWIYEVRMMTASGSVVELDFNADGLGLIGARGPENDRDAAGLVKALGGETALLTTGVTNEGSRSKGPNAAGNGQGSGQDRGGDDDHGNGNDDGHGEGGGDDGGESGEGGNSGSGSDHSASGGGEGGNSGSGGGNSGSGGEGGSDD
jgi:hypothetical protein